MSNNQRINILYIGIGPYSGGPVVSLVQLIENIDKKNYNTFVLSLPSPHTDTLLKLKNIGDVKIIETQLWINNWLQSSNRISEITLWQKLKAPGRFLRLLYNSWQISKLIKKNNIDLIHTNIELVLEGAIGAWLANRPHIWHIRAPLGDNGAVKHFLGQKFCCAVISSLSNRVIVNSISTQTSIIPFIDQKKIRLIYNGISPNKFDSQKSNNGLRKLLSISEDKKIIASIGYLSKIKGGKEFINIALDICKAIDDIVFVWIGESIERKDDDFCKEIFRVVESNNLENRILFTGERHDINLLLSDVDLFLQPMVNGSWSRVVLEAMAASVPVIAIEQNLTSEFIINNKTGILAKDEKEASEKIKNIICNKGLLREIGENGHKIVLSRFTNEITAKKIMAVYDETILRKCR